jgi:hypothetical protein
MDATRDPPISSIALTFLGPSWPVTSWPMTTHSAINWPHALAAAVWNGWVRQRGVALLPLHFQQRWERAQGRPDPDDEGTRALQNVRYYTSSEMASHFRRPKLGWKAVCFSTDINISDTNSASILDILLWKRRHEVRKKHLSTSHPKKPKSLTELNVCWLQGVTVFYVISWKALYKTVSLKAHWLLCVPLGLTLRNSTFCPHSVFMCFVWISEQTAIIYLYSINWLVFITETECLVRGTDWVFKHNWG